MCIGKKCCADIWIRHGSKSLIAKKNIVLSFPGMFPCFSLRYTLELKCASRKKPHLQVLSRVRLGFPIIFNLTLFLRLYEWAYQNYTQQGSTHLIKSCPGGVYCLSALSVCSEIEIMLLITGCSSSHPQILF